MLCGDDNLLIRRNQIATLFDHLGTRDVPMCASPLKAIRLQAAHNLNAALTRTFGHRHGHIGRVNVAVCRVVQSTLKRLGVDQRPARFDLIGHQEFVRHTTGFRRRGINHVFVHTLFGLCHAQVANNCEACVQPCFRL